MSYRLSEHGDVLEKEAAKLISDRFSNYELVWQTYIGNKGDNSIGEIPNYSNPRKRNQFAENSYTVLESAFIIDHILNDKFINQSFSNFDDYIEFNKSFITIFALLGRMHDTVIKASDALGYDNTEFKESIHKFYEARSIVIHGKKVPIIYDDLGLPKIPILKTESIDGDAWDDKHSLWSDISQMDTEYVIDKVNGFFNDFLVMINNEYAVFYNCILQELKSINTSLIFDYINSPSHEIPDTSGSTSYRRYCG